MVHGIRFRIGHAKLLPKIFMLRIRQGKREHNPKLFRSFIVANVYSNYFCINLCINKAYHFFMVDSLHFDSSN